MNIIETNNLTKKYKDKTAVDSVNLTVKEGELFSLLGVNGAGKTTTIRMLSCLSTPTSGEAFVDGNNVKEDKEKIKRIIGISPQDTAVAESRCMMLRVAATWHATPSRFWERES